MHLSNYSYYHDEQELLGYLAFDTQKDHARPGVLVVHDWTGRNEFACHKAELLAKMGYVSFAVDMYGGGQLGNTIEEKQALMQPLIKNRQLLKDRINAGFQVIKGFKEVDTQRIAVIGFCFGGMCALDLARSGADIVGAVSFHGLLNKPDLPHHQINAKILALHGYDDPMVTPDEVNVFCQEMTLIKVDWQVQMYGHTQHAFTNPEAHDNKLGTVYNAKVAERSWQSMTHFFQEIFS